MAAQAQGGWQCRNRAGGSAEIGQVALQAWGGWQRLTGQEVDVNAPAWEGAGAQAGT